MALAKMESANTQILQKGGHTLQLTRKLSEELSALFGAGFALGAMLGNQILSK